jgi:hypothetical protein
LQPVFPFTVFSVYVIAGVTVEWRERPSSDFPIVFQVEEGREHPRGYNHHYES